MLAKLKGLVAIFFSIQSGLGTVFWADNDPQNPDPNLACYGRPLHDRRDFVIAHRTLPCKAPVLVCAPRTGKCVAATVGDRGPYGKTKNGRWKAIADLSPAVSRKLGHNGLEPVILLTR